MAPAGGLHLAHASRRLPMLPKIVNTAFAPAIAWQYGNASLCSVVVYD
jgi:hypothetical protein